MNTRIILKKTDNNLWSNFKPIKILRRRALFPRRKNTKVFNTNSLEQGVPETMTRLVAGGAGTWNM